MRRINVGLVLLIAASAFAAMKPPVATIAGNGVRIALPTEMLRDSEVRRELRNGLTTTFVVTAQDGDRRGGARVDVRYELWDEVYVVRAIGIDAREEHATLPSEAALEQWWSSPHATLLALSGVAPKSLEVRVEVLPFSVSEEADAKRWLLRSAASGAAAPNVSPAQSSSARTPLLDAVIGTSVRRKPLLSYVWRVTPIAGPTP